MPCTWSAWAWVISARGTGRQGSIQARAAGQLHHVDVPIGSHVSSDRLVGQWEPGAVPAPKEGQLHAEATLLFAFAAQLRRSLRHGAARAGPPCRRPHPAEGSLHALRQRGGVKREGGHPFAETGHRPEELVEAGPERFEAPCHRELHRPYVP